MALKGTGPRWRYRHNREGKLADLIILNRNPLENIRHTDTIYQVMKNGRLYDGDTLNEVWPRMIPAGPFPFQLEEPNGLPGLQSMSN
jgi:hypothetical protein